MGALGKDGKYYANPAHAREHDRNAAIGSRPARDGGGDDGQDHGPVHETQVLHPDHPDNPSPGKHHVIARHEDGHEEHSDHDSAEEAHAHAAALEGEGDGQEGVEHEGMGEDEENGAGTCPDCGRKMVDGECQECGYKEGGDGDEDDALDY